MKEDIRWPISAVLAFYAGDCVYLAFSNALGTPGAVISAALAALALFLLSRARPRRMRPHMLRIVCGVVLAGISASAIAPQPGVTPPWIAISLIGSPVLYAFAFGRYPLQAGWKRRCAERRERSWADASTEMASIGLDVVIEKCREAFGTAPRRIPIWLRLAHFRVRRPRWCQIDNGLYQYFMNRDHLIREGTVVWAHLIQANELLFRDGWDDCPALVVYCLDPNERDLPGKLQEIASRVFSLRYKKPEDISLQPIAASITDEYSMVLGFPIPDSISQGVPSAMSAVYVQRKHLPNRKISKGLFPIVLSQTNPRIVMILPCRYWPKPLRTLWSRPTWSYD